MLVRFILGGVAHLPRPPPLLPAQRTWKGPTHGVASFGGKKLSEHKASKLSTWSGKNNDILQPALI